MKTPLLSAVQSYKPETPPESAYLRARREWDDQMGNLVIRTKNWRLAALFSTLVAILLSIAICILSKQIRVIPVMVGLDSKTGQAVSLGPIPEKPYQPGALEIQFFLTEFIRYVRAVPADPVVIKQNWLRAYKMMRPEAAKQLNELANNESGPLKRIGEVTVIVQPISVTQVPGSTSYQVRWQETVFERSGLKLQDYTMTALFGLEFQTPEDLATINENPLGLFIQSFQWNREL